MRNKKTIFAILILGIILNVVTIFHTPKSASENIKLTFSLTANQVGNVQVFYEENNQFSEENSQSVVYQTVDEMQEMSFSMPANSEIIRLDFMEASADLKIQGIYFEYLGRQLLVEQDDFFEAIQSTNQVDKNLTEDGELLFEVNIDDPYIIMDISQFNLEEFSLERQKEADIYKKIAICIVLNVIIIVIIKYAHLFSGFILELFENRKLIFRLAKNDFKTRFAGSYLGIVWAFVQPVVTVLVYWFVFQVGLRSGDVGNFPFVLWLIAGLVPWFFFSEALNNGTNALLEYNYLVKKVVFKISIIPIVKVISALFVHLFFLAFTLVLYALYGYYPDLYTLQVFYYTICIFVFVLGLSYTTCAIVVFFRDLTQIINIILQVGVWMTPIMWNISILPDNLTWIFKLNPLYYIVFGYRNALINKIWFWEEFYMTAYFWLLTAIIFGIGALLFRRLKVHFADVL